jgi:hypothetical protein
MEVLLRFIVITRDYIFLLTNWPPTDGRLNSIQSLKSGINAPLLTCLLLNQDLDGGEKHICWISKKISIIIRGLTLGNVEFQSL